MSIIYTSGGAASIADATTTTSGKVRLATIAEAGGSSEAIAVTPAGLQAEISGLVSGITYRGQIAVADFGTTLANASQGDYYKISVGGTSGGVVYDANDSIIVNADMGGTFADAKLDRLDNVDSEVVDDLTPQLGGDLDVNGHTITSAVGDIVIDPAGAGEITVGADVIPDADATHSLGAEAERFATAWANLNGAVQFKAQNASGGPISKGDALYIAGVSGSVPTVGLAQANSSLRMPAFGLAGHDANSGAEVQVVTFGNIEGYNTTTLSLSRGDTLYISATNAGEVTNTAPAGEGNFIQNIGRVVRAHVDSGILKVGGAGRSNATPNLNNGNIFIGDASNQSTSAALSSVAVTSLNGSAGAVVLSANDLAADHVASNYTAANANIDGHLSGIDSALSAVAPSAASETVAGIIEIATNAEATAATATDKAIVPSNLSSLNVSTLNNDAGYITSAPVSSVNGATGAVVLSANDLAADHVASNYTAGNANIDGHLSGIDSALSAVAPSAASETVAGIIEIATNAEAATATATDKAIVPSNLSSLNVSTLNNDAGYITSAPVSSVNGATGAVVLSANDLAADHVASNYTAANANIDGHLSGIDTALSAVAPSAASETVAGIIEIATNAEATAATATDKAIVPSNLSSLNVSTLNNDAGYITSAPVSSVNGATGVVVVSANDLAADHVATNYTAANANIDGHLSGIDSALSAVAPSAASETVAGIIEIATNAEAATATATDKAIVPSNLSSLNVSTLNNDAGYITSAPVSSVNGATGAVVLSANDLAADHTATNYTAANANIDGHLSGIDAALASAGGGGYTINVDDTSITTSSVTLGAPTVDHQYYIVKNSTNAITINLVAAATATKGFQYTFKIEGSGTVTIDPSGTEYIDHSGQTTYVPVQYDAITLLCDGANWWLV